MLYPIDFEAIERDVDQLHSSTVEEAEQLESVQLHDLASLASHLVGQLVHGCDNPACRNSLCFTGRCSVSTAPVRKHTTRSARIIVLAHLFKTGVSTRVCHFYTPGAPIIEDSQPRDLSSFEQRLVDVDIIQQMMVVRDDKKYPSAGSVAQKVARAKLNRVLQLCGKVKAPPYRSDGSRNPDFLLNTAATHHILTILRYFIRYMAELCPPIELAGNDQAMDDCTISLDPKDVPFYRTRETHLKNVAITEHLPRSHGLILLKHLCDALLYRFRLDNLATKVGVEHLSVAELASQHLRRVYSQGLTAEEDVNWRSKFFCQLMRLLLCTEWDGKPVIKRDSLTFVALGLLNGWNPANDDLIDDIYYFDDVLGRPRDYAALAESYLRHEEERSDDTVHVLDYGFLFGDVEFEKMFKIINYRRMSYSHAIRSIIARQSHEFFCEPGQEMSVPSHEAIRNIKKRYLLLRVRRDDILQDAFSQLWQRPALELHKPLRVRIVELDGQAMGQDLGGVQIEFFSCVMNAIMQDDADLFVTNETGIAYFKPGSLQPLHMFEYVGILMGLALYNGITIPVRLPIVLYHIIMSKDYTIKHMQDRWKAETASMEEMIHADVTAWQLSYDFNLAANGVQLVVSPDALSTTKDTLPIIDAKSSDRPFQEVDMSDAGWPGWSLPHRSTESKLVDNDNKEQFCKDYIHWLTQKSVQPQLNAFLHGFQQVMHPYTMKMLHYPRSLRGLLEGEDIVEVSAVRQCTSYDGFEGTSEYIMMFWEILESWSSDQLKALVRFVTAAERLPRDGVLEFKISRLLVEGDGRLPTSSTCFSTLYLPVYSSKEVLEKNLTTAVELGEYGFGIG
ncbi:hypothetical protein AMS68_007850 [Peltaster fructicola]|uniref:HECT-type E3 ubiquitin transferase n=1 Tax=Peltaster fructicola TaxID=286661 RepID=A0A6H0Y5Q5_9PEZI|nr:hypothetical protein AMS68_007850 [Peltaster fructicola]